MKVSRRLIAGVTLASFIFAAPLAAQEGSMQVGGATVTVGVGTAILTLPDVPSFVTRAQNALGATFIEGFKLSDNFDDEIGGNVNGSITLPMTGANGRAKEVSLSGYWANIQDEDTSTCQSTGPTICIFFALVDEPGIRDRVGAPFGTVTTRSDRDVDFWGGSLETKWTLNPGVMGVTQAPNRRYFSLGADIRGITQELDVRLTTANVVAGAGFAGPATYNEDLDTTYYGIYAAFGGDYSPFFFNALWERLGLQSSIRIQGGIYYANTDYDGVLRDNSNITVANATSALSLSDDDVAFIGGITLETSKRISRRASLSLKSEYEYYSYVPEMAYNTVDNFVAGIIPFTPGRQVGTVIGDDDAFSARTSLRLTIKLGPDSVFEPQ